MDYKKRTYSKEKNINWSVRWRVVAKLSLMLVIVIIVVPFLKAYADEVDNITSAFYYFEDAEGVTITGVADPYSIFDRDPEYEFLLGTMKIPEMIDGKKVTGIADRAFADLWVKTEIVYLPKTIKRIGDDIFGEDYHEIKHVYYDGTIEEYRNIDIGSNKMLEGAFIHHIKQKVNPIDYDFEYPAEGNPIVYGGYIKKNGTLYNFDNKKIATKIKDAALLTEKTYYSELYYLTEDGKFYVEYDERDEKNWTSVRKKKLLMKGVARYPMASHNINSEQYVITKKGVLYRLDVSIVDSKVTVKKTKIMKKVKDFYYDTAGNPVRRNMNYFIMKKDNTLWGYGDNKHYELGQGDAEAYEKPVKIMSNVAEFTYGVGTWGTSPREGEGVCFAIKTDGSLWGWGSGEFDAFQITGDGNITKPKQLLDEVVNMDYDNHHIACLRADGVLWMWGTKVGEDWGYTENEGTLLISNSGIVRIADNVKYMDMSSWWIYFIKNDNALYVYGNIDGADKVPQKLLSKVKYVSSQIEGDYAVRTDGTLYYFNEIKDVGKDKPKKVTDGL